MILIIRTTTACTATAANAVTPISTATPNATTATVTATATTNKRILKEKMCYFFPPKQSVFLSYILFTTR
jgi:hypothetical protein